MKCEICGKEYKGLAGLSTHIGNTHKNEIKIKDYYDKYLKKEGESKCLECGKETNFIDSKKGYYKFCSLKCSQNNKQTKEKKKQTWLKKYGVGHPMQNKKVHEKFIQSMIDKYGTKCALQSKEIRNKKDITMIQNYGVKHPYQSEEIRKRGEQTCLKNNGIDNIFKDAEYIKKRTFKKYGVEYIMKLKAFVNKGKQTCKDKYGEDHFLKTEEGMEKLKQTNQKIYGADYPSQTKEIQEKIKQTRIKNGNQIPDNQLSNLEIYRQSVFYFTNLSLKKKYKKEELEKRKINGTNGGLQIDHKFSIIEGFKQNVLPCIIGSQYNLELITWEDNAKKRNKCSITKEELFELYEQEIKKT